MNIAITGASGFIGSYLSDYLSSLNHKLFLISNRSHLISNEIASKKNIQIVKGNIGQKKVQSIIVNKNINAIVNLSAQTDLYFAEGNVYQDYFISVLPIIKLLSYLTKENYKCKIIQIGTATQCGLTPNYPINEDYIDDPKSVFDYHKLCAENYIKYFNNNSSIESICFRLSNVYGGSKKNFSPSRGVINKVIKTALEKKTITLYGNGNYLRDYIHINDVVKFINCAIVYNKKQLLGKHVFLCYGKSYSIREVWNLIAEIIWDLYSIKIVVQKKSWPKNLLEIEKRNFRANNSMLVDNLKTRPTYGLDNGLRNNIYNIFNELNN